MAQLIMSKPSRGSFVEWCQSYGISRKNGYKWLNRTEGQGVEGLEDRSRRPRHQPARSKDETEEAINAAPPGFREIAMAAVFGKKYKLTPDSHAGGARQGESCG